MATKERIVEVSRLPVEGEHYPSFRDVRLARAEFIVHGDPPISVDKLGTKRTSFPKPWKQAVVYIIRYVTCKGRLSNLHSAHFKLLSHMRDGRRMNVPNALYNLLPSWQLKHKKVWTIMFPTIS